MNLVLGVRFAEASSKEQVIQMYTMETTNITINNKTSALQLLDGGWYDEELGLHHAFNPLYLKNNK